MDLLVLLREAALRKDTSVNFTDLDSAVRNALAEHLSGENGRVRTRFSDADFEIIEEIIDEVVPLQVEDILGKFADVQTFARDEKVIFTIKSVGTARVMRAIVPGARAGIYEARRLDKGHLEVTTYMETVGYSLSLEDILSGRVTMQDYTMAIARGFIELVYQRMIAALRQAAGQAPAANRVTITQPEITELAPGLDKVIRVVSAYGTPHVFGFSSITDNLFNYMQGAGLPANAYAGADVDEIRNMGRVSVYKGRSVVTLPNFLTDNSNSEWVFTEDELFVLPVNEKPIKVAFYGQTHVQQVNIPSGGAEWHAHRELGVAVLTQNSIGSVKVTSLAGTGLH